MHFYLSRVSVNLYLEALLKIFPFAIHNLICENLWGSYVYLSSTCSCAGLLFSNLPCKWYIWSEYCWDRLCSWLPVKIWRCNTSFKAYTTAIIPPWSTYSVRIQCTEFTLACLSLCHLTSSLCALMRPYIALVYLPQFPSRFLPRPIRYYLESFGLVACSTS